MDTHQTPIDGPDTVSLGQLLELAGTAHQAGRWDEAAEGYRRILAAMPDHADALHLFGVLHGQTGRPQRAVRMIQRALKLAGEHPAYLLNLGHVYAQMGRDRDAETMYRRGAAADPENADIWMLLGAVRRRLGDLDGAEFACREAARLAPDDPRSHNNLGNVLRDRGRPADAEHSYRTAIARAPDFATAHLNLAIALNDFDRFDEAEAAFKRALALDPANADAHNARGRALLERGRLDAAAESFRRAIAADPNCVDAYYNLAEFRDRPMDGALVAGMEALLAREGMGADARIKLHFALGDAADRMGQPAAAFAHYCQGNEIARAEWAAKGATFDLEAHRDHVLRIARTFSQSFFSERPWYGLDTDAPVFIVGMPRSGTSLVEQILASHPAIRGAGERPEIAELAAVLGDFPEAVADLTVGEAHRMSLRYFDAVVAGGEARCVTDKMPGNALYLGLIALLFPRAQVIHCRRDPRDTGLSIYTRHFPGALPWATDLRDIAAVQQSTDELMAYWATALPLPILSVDYERLVAEPERQARRMVKFLGLDWDPACLDFQATVRAVRTASKWQVRQPVSRASVGRWRKYETELAPLIEALAGV